MTRLCAALFFALIGLPAAADCPRDSAFDALPLEQREELTARAQAYPFGEGIFWKAEKDGITSYIVGTYHLPDPRFAPLLDQISRLLPDLDHLLMEANWDTQTELNTRISTDPSLAFITEGPTLIDRLSPEDWATISAAAAARGVPSVLAAKYQPWFLGLTLAIPSCALPQIVAGTPGLDRQIETLFADKNLPAISLDTVDGLIATLASDPIDKQVEDLQRGLDMGLLGIEDDMTLSEMYFRQQPALLWEYTIDKALTSATDRAEVLVLIEEMEQAVLHGRNTAWAPEILGHLNSKPTLVAVGALHLFGDTGILPMLQAEGFEVTRMPLDF